MNATFPLVFGVLCCFVCWSSSAAVTKDKQQDAATVDLKHAIDPELEALAADSSNLEQDDRGKRQLSSVQSKLLNFLKVRTYIVIPGILFEYTYFQKDLILILIQIHILKRV